jgi:hypothetical protein
MPVFGAQAPGQQENSSLLTTGAQTQPPPPVAPTPDDARRIRRLMLYFGMVYAVEFPVPPLCHHNRRTAQKVRKHEAATRSEAIRRLVDLGLTVKTKGHQSKEGQKAGSAIDDMTDTAASPDDQASRKRRLLKGPEEFRNVRVDRLRKA